LPDTKAAPSVPAICCEAVMSTARTFTPELMANGRYRYEETDEPVAAIAVDFGVHPRTFREYTRKWGWRQRKDRPPLDLSPALRALAEAAAAAPPEASSAAAGGDGCAGRSGEPASIFEAGEPGQAAAAPEIGAASLIARLEAAVEKELAAVERMRAHLGGTAQEPVEAERTARTLATLARTLREVQRLRGAGLQSAGRDDDDDMPTDIDELRRELARRIHAFVDSRADRPLRGADEPAGGDGSAA
jgi:hypothetical protein